MKLFVFKLAMIMGFTLIGISGQAQTERCDSLIGDWLLTKVHYKFSKEPIIFAENHQDFAAISKNGINYFVLLKTSDIGPIFRTVPTTDPGWLLTGLGGIRNINVISIQPNEVVFEGEKDGRMCKGTLMRKPN
ncbi:MAG: hypothetical protein JXQ87_14405 [Bacteroidia bacterium]